MHMMKYGRFGFSWVSGPVCQLKAFQLNNLEVAHCAFKSLKLLRMSFSSCILSRVGFTSEQFSSAPQFVTSLQCFYVKQTDSSGAQSVPVFSNRGRKIHKHSPKSAL